MAHEWDRGILNASSWHGLETIENFTDANSAIAHGESSGAWPTQVAYEKLVTTSGLPCEARAVVGAYSQHDSRVLGVVGDRYHATTPEQWRDLIRAAVAAGAKPTGAFSLRNGSRVLATFDVGQSNGLKTHLVLADSFDGTMRLTCGDTSVRVVCANTLASSMSQDGQRAAKLRHTASLPEKVDALTQAIEVSLQDGQKVRETYDAAVARQLTRDEAESILDALWPQAADDASKAAQTKAVNARKDAARAMRNPLNNEGKSLATIWNAATWLVDRTAGGQPRAIRGGGDRLDSMLFGQRAKRVQEVQELVQVILRDGTVEAMTVAKAVDAGALDGRQLLDSML